VIVDVSVVIDDDTVDEEDIVEFTNEEIEWSIATDSCEISFVKN